MQNFTRLGTMVDCSRNAVMKLPTLKRWIDLTADIGYNTFLLYIEDTYEVDNQPRFGYLRGRYSKEELKKIEEYCALRNMEFIPCIQVLAHLETIFRWEEYKKIHDCLDILLTDEEDTYRLVEDIFSTLSKTLKTRTVNIGMDEAHELGRGMYLDKHGYKERNEIFLRHLKKVAEIAQKYDFELIMWGDMFFGLSNNTSLDDKEKVYASIKKQIPDNVRIIYWDYYSSDRSHYDTRIKEHKAIKDDIWFAGGIWSWGGIAPHNTYTINNMEKAIESCKENNVQDVFFTLWGDNGSECSKFAVLPALYYVAELSKGNTNEAEIKKSFFDKFGIEFDDFCLLDLPETPLKSSTSASNAEKYMLYNDCFTGLFDEVVNKGDKNSYKECAEKLSKLANNKEYGYIFKKYEALCSALQVKFDLGERTRRLYLENNKAELKKLISDYDLFLERLNTFYEAFCNEWDTDNKPFGFEVQDIRLGGLMQRVRHCKVKLLAFINGDIANIEELDEPRTKCADSVLYEGINNRWKTIVTVNNI